MKPPHDPLTAQGCACHPQPDRLEVIAGKVVATMSQPSATQQRFNTLMERIHAEQALAGQIRHALDTHGNAHRHALHDLAQRQVQVCKSMLHTLDARIQAPTKPKGLTAQQKRQAMRIVLGLCEQLSDAADAADDDVQAVYQRYAEVDDLDEAAQQAARQTQELLESYLGAGFAQGRTFESPEAVLRAAMEFEQNKQQAQHDKRNAKRAARKAQKSATPRGLAAQQKELDAHNALRTVFRQLASALHPDREPDEALRTQKTALMSEVNAAYERKDLNALLRIQLQAELVDAGKAAQLSEAKLKAMCDLLTEQLRALETDTQQLRQAMQFHYGYRPTAGFDEAAFLAVLQQKRSAVQHELAQLEHDLQQVQDDTLLKAWLKTQTRLSKRSSAYDAEEGLDLDELLSARVRRR